MLYQPLGAEEAVTFNYTQDKEVMELAVETAGDLAALVLTILEKIGNAHEVENLAAKITILLSYIP